MAKKELTRRQFIRNTSIKLAATGLLLNQCSTEKNAASNKKAAPNMEYRTLGKTGLKVSTISFGVMRLKEPAVLYKALDLGINYFDTAESYQNGNNETMLGKVAKEYGREKVIIATKIHPFHMQQNMSDNFQMLERKELNERMDKCLKRLQTIIIKSKPVYDSPIFHQPE